MDFNFQILLLFVISLGAVRPCPLTKTNTAVAKDEVVAGRILEESGKIKIKEGEAMINASIARMSGAADAEKLEADAIEGEETAEGIESQLPAAENKLNTDEGIGAPKMREITNLMNKYTKNLKKAADEERKTQVAGMNDKERMHYLFRQVWRRSALLMRK